MDKLDSKYFPRHLTAAAIFLTSFCWMLYCAAPSLYWGDSAEMASVACSIGIAHSPGYPLFTVLARIFLWLPLPVAFAAHIMSLLFAAAAVALLFYFLSRLTGQIFAPALGAIFFAGIPAFISYSLFIEVYALHLFLFCAALCCIAGIEKSGDERWFNTALLVFALGVSHHILMYFALAAFFAYCLLRPGHRHRAAAGPLLLFFAWSFMNLLASHELAPDTLGYYRTGLIAAAALYAAYIALTGWFARREFPYVAAAALAGLFIFAAGVGIFAYLPLSSARGPVSDWWSPDTPGNFLNLLFLKGYPPTFPDTMLEVQKRLDFGGLLVQTSIPMLCAALAGLFALLFKNARIALFLLLTGLLTLIGAMLVKHGKPEALRLPVYLVLSALAAYSFAWLYSWRLWRGKRWKLALIAPLYIAAAGFVALTLFRADFRQMNRSGSAYELGDSIIKETAQRSILFIGEQTPGIMGYFSACEPERLRKKKIVVVPVSFLSFDWKVDQLRDEYPGIYFPPVIKKPDEQNIFTSSGSDRVNYTIQMLRQNPEIKNVFSDFYFLPLDSGLHTVPQGVVYRIAGMRQYAAFQIQSMFEEDKPPRWLRLAPGDELAAENIASVNNERGIVFLRYGRMFNNAAFIRRAEAEFDAALKINPKYAEAMSNKGACALFFGDEKQAVKLQRKAVKIQPDKAEVLNALAETLLQTHTLRGAAEAIATMMASLAIKPKQPQVFYNLGAAYTMVQDKDKAVMFYKMAIETDPLYIEPYRALARINESLDKCGDAASYLEMATDRVPRDIDIRAELVKLYSRCGWKNLFNDGMRAIYTDFPHDAVFFQTVGTIYRDLGRLDYTMKIYDQARARDPRFKLVNLFLSLTAEDCENNLPILGKAVSMKPDDFALRLHYASVLCLCNQRVSCEANLLEAKRIDPSEEVVDSMLAEVGKIKKAYPELFNKSGEPGAR